MKKVLTSASKINVVSNMNMYLSLVTNVYLPASLISISISVSVLVYISVSVSGYTSGGVELVLTWRWKLDTQKGCILYLQISVDLSGNLWR